MSAMHWEARRRQRALERRMAKQQLVLSRPEAAAAVAAEPPIPSPNATQQPTGGGQCRHCGLQTDVHHSARIPNRYSSLQYSQQW